MKFHDQSQDPPDSDVVEGVMHLLTSSAYSQRPTIHSISDIDIPVWLRPDLSIESYAQIAEKLCFALSEASDVESILVALKELCAFAALNQDTGFAASIAAEGWAASPAESTRWELAIKLIYADLKDSPEEILKSDILVTAVKLACVEVSDFLDISEEEPTVSNFKETIARDDIYISEALHEFFAVSSEHEKAVTRALEFAIFTLPDTKLHDETIPLLAQSFSKDLTHAVQGAVLQGYQYQIGFQDDQIKLGKHLGMILFQTTNSDRELALLVENVHATLEIQDLAHRTRSFTMITTVASFEFPTWRRFLAACERNKSLFVKNDVVTLCQTLPDIFKSNGFLSLFLEDPFCNSLISRLSGDAIAHEAELLFSLLSQSEVISRQTLGQCAKWLFRTYGHVAPENLVEWTMVVGEFANRFPDLFYHELMSYGQDSSDAAVGALLVSRDFPTNPLPSSPVLLESAIRLLRKHLRESQTISSKRIPELITTFKQMLLLIQAMEGQEPLKIKSDIE